MPYRRLEGRGARSMTFWSHAKYVFKLQLYLLVRLQKCKFGEQIRAENDQLSSVRPVGV